jgi:hypothetical protein
VSTPNRSSFVAVIAVLASIACGTTAARAQGVEITPFGGYRFGGDFFELITDQPVDLDGSVSFGVAVDIPLQRSDGFQIEGLFSHQQADLTLQPTKRSPVRLARATVDHWLGGGLQEFGGDRVRPFLTGMLGLTRYAGGGGDSEIRFTLSAGGGVKLFPTRHLGVRLDGRVYTTFVEADVGLFACSSFSGTCIVGFHTDVVWQAEGTAGVVFRF